ncbi:MAG: YdjY domain-containing protein [Planctomycetota bacterium]
MHERAPATNDDAPIDATFLEEEVFDEGLLDDIASQSRINTEPAATPRATLREVFPGIRVDAEAGIVEFDGVVPIDTRNERAPDVYLEVIVCAPDSKEHEALVMADVRASHLHAALLLLGAEPGAPGRWSRADAKLRAEPPTGRRVRVELIAEGALPVPPSAWMRPEFGGSAPPETAWVFAGSLVADRDQDGLDEYAADRTGLLVGLHSFGSEVVAWTHMAHPDSSVETPAWLANNDVMPAAGEPVTIRLTLD